MALVPLIEALNKSFNISTTTNTGFTYASRLTNNPRFLPYEIFLPFWMRQHHTLVVLEAELWYMLFFMAKKRGMKTILLNARISDKSYASYKKFAFFYRYIFAYIDHVYAQTQTDADRLRELGAKNVLVSGNIKLTSKPHVTKVYDKPLVPIITAASTHAEEEKLILDAYEISMGKLIIVPRHPERFESVYTLMKAHTQHTNISISRWSQKENFDADITLIDTMGELVNIYAITDTVILGGAFAKIGGHNPLEPAFFETAIISGEHYFNQKETFRAVDNIQIVDPKNLKHVLHSKRTKCQINISMNIEDIIKEIEN